MSDLLKRMQADAIKTAESMSQFQDYIKEAVGISFECRTLRFVPTKSGKNYQWSAELACTKHAVKAEVGNTIWFNISAGLDRSASKKKKDGYDLSTLLSALQLDHAKAMKLMLKPNALNEYLAGACGVSMKADSIHKTENGIVFQNFDNIVSI
jgi:hypothetical protein